MSSQSFNPSTTNSYILYNQNYNVIPVKIRLKDVPPFVERQIPCWNAAA